MSEDRVGWPFWERLLLLGRDLRYAVEDLTDEVGERLFPIWKAARDWVIARPAIATRLPFVVSVSAATIIGALYQQFLGLPSFLLLFLPTVVASTIWGGLAQGVAASFMGALVTIVLFMGSSFKGGDLQRDIVSIALYALSCAIVVGLCRAQEAQRRQIAELAHSLEERVSERTAELQAANDELAGFCYNISHDLRAPMRNMVGSSRILIEDAGEKLEDPHKARLRSIANSANRLSQLVDDLLNYARIGSQTMKSSWVDLTWIADEICREIDHSQHPFSKLELKVQPNMVAQGDRAMLATVLRNLVENACKYSNEGQPLKLEIGETRQRGKRIYFVRDNGIGFDMQYLPKIFQPFQRLHRDTEYDGTGIGLANVKRIIERHGGQIWAESVPKQGSTFFFTLGEKRKANVVLADEQP